MVKTRRWIGPVSFGGIKWDDTPWMRRADRLARESGCPIEQAVDREIYRAFLACIADPLAHLLGLHWEPAPWLRAHIGNALLNSPTTECPVVLIPHRRGESGPRVQHLCKNEKDTATATFERIASGIDDMFDVFSDRMLARFTNADKVAVALVGLVFKNGMLPPLAFRIRFAEMQLEGSNLPFEFIPVDGQRKDGRYDMRRSTTEVVRRFYCDEQVLVGKETYAAAVAAGWGPKEATTVTALIMSDPVRANKAIELVRSGVTPAEAVSKAIEKLGAIGSISPVGQYQFVRTYCTK
jgi:hypothetical protein